MSDAISWAAESPDVPGGAKHALAEALAAAPSDPRAIAATHGLSCALPGAFIVALAIASKPEYNYIQAARANLMAGGDSASRANVVGALKAAQEGGVPEGWAAKVLKRDELEDDVEKLVGARGTAATA